MKEKILEGIQGKEVMSLEEYSEYVMRFNSLEEVTIRITDVSNSILELIKTKSLEDPSSREIVITNAIHIMNVGNDNDDLIAEVLGETLLENGIEAKKISLKRLNVEGKRDEVEVRWDYSKKK